MRDHLRWPFFEEQHRALATELEAWARRNLDCEEHEDPDAASRRLVAMLGTDGWLRYCAGSSDGGALQNVDARALCIIRETLAYYDPLADFAFAMQGLGSGPLVFAGTPQQRERYLRRIVRGEAVAAFALSEESAGSDAAALETKATADRDGYVLRGEKTWISNGGIADVYLVFARTGEGGRSRGISVFVIDADEPGLQVTHRIRTLSPHPLGTICLDGCRVGPERLVGQAGDGFRLAMRTLDVFRASVAAAALGFARRALDAALEHAAGRSLFSQKLLDFQLTRASIAEMATSLDASTLLTYRAAWTRDVAGEAATRDAAMAKMFSTETAQRSIDRAVQLFGALGVSRGNVAERLYREIRSLRIYEGATEVQQLIIARETIARHEARVAAEA